MHIQPGSRDVFMSISIYCILYILLLLSQWYWNGSKISYSSLFLAAIYREYIYTPESFKRCTKSLLFPVLTLEAASQWSLHRKQPHAGGLQQNALDKISTICHKLPSSKVYLSLLCFTVCVASQNHNGGQCCFVSERQRRKSHHQIDLHIKGVSQQEGMTRQVCDIL